MQLNLLLVQTENKAKRYENGMTKKNYVTDYENCSINEPIDSTGKPQRSM